MTGKALQILSILSIIMLSSCAAMSQKHHKGNAEPYYEDLSAVHPVFVNPDTLTGKTTAPVNTAPQVFQYDASKKVNARIDSLSEINKKYSTMPGYRILVYTGPSSDEAQKNRQLVYTYNSDLNVYTQFKQPSFRVKVGDFTDRVEANYILNDLKQSFPNAMIVPDQINLLR